MGQGASTVLGHLTEEEMAEFVQDMHDNVGSGNEPALLEQVKEIGEAAEKNERLRELFVQAGGLRALLNVAYSENPRMMYYSAMAIANLSLSEKLQGPMSKAGALDPLFEMTRSRSQLTQIQVSKAFAHLANNADNAEYIMSRGIYHIVLLARSVNADVQEHAALALRNLARNERARAEGGREGALASLVQILRSAQRPSLQLVTAQALTVFASHPSNRRKIVSDGALLPLVELAQKHYKAPLRTAAMQCLAYVSGEAANAERIMAEGGLAPMVHMVRHGSKEMRLAATTALANCADNPRNQKVLTDANLFQLMLPLTNGSDPALQGEASRCLANLGKHTSDRGQMSKGLGSLLSLLGSDEPEVQLEALRFLTVLVKDAKVRAKVHSRGRLTRLVEVGRSKSLDVAAEAALVLSEFASDIKYKQILHRAGAIQVLANNLFISNDRLLENSMRCLIAFGTDASEYQLAIGNCDVFRSLQEIGSSTTDYELKELTFLLVSVLAERPENQSRLVDVGIIETLGSVLGSGSKEQGSLAMQRVAACAVANLSMSVESQIKIMQSRVLSPLIEVLQRSRDFEITFHAARAIAHLSINSQNKLKIAQSGAVWSLIHMCKREEEYIQYQAVLALFNLSVLPANKQTIIQNGALPALIALMNSSNYDVQDVVLATIANLE